MTSDIFDPTPCHLGEGPLWHPGRSQLFWFDILQFRLHAHTDSGTRTWQFDEHVSAAGWVDDRRLMVASETRLFLFDLETGADETIVPLEADTPATRSNDGRADPWGGFWIGSMGKQAETGAGAIYRYYKGELRRLYPKVTISNAICFSPDRRWAYFTDTPTRVVQRVALAEADGWPDGDPEPWLDLNAEGWRPDGAVVAADGTFWNAQWGGSRVARYDKGGSFMNAIAFPATNTTCPAFGGDDFGTLYCTSARTGLPSQALLEGSVQGCVFSAEVDAQGVPEPQVIL